MFSVLIYLISVCLSYIMDFITKLSMFLNIMNCLVLINNKVLS